jgi:hypothetical protein
MRESLRRSMKVVLLHNVALINVRFFKEPVALQKFRELLLAYRWKRYFFGHSQSVALNFFMF